MYRTVITETYYRCLLDFHTLSNPSYIQSAAEITNSQNDPSAVIHSKYKPTLRPKYQGILIILLIKCTLCVYFTGNPERSTYKEQLEDVLINKVQHYCFVHISLPDGSVNFGITFTRVLFFELLKIKKTILLKNQNYVTNIQTIKNSNSVGR